MSSVSKKSENSEKPKLSRLSACKCGCMQRCELYVSHQLSPHSAKPTAFPLSQVRAPIDVGAKARKVRLSWSPLQLAQRLQLRRTSCVYDHDSPGHGSRLEPLIRAARHCRDVGHCMHGHAVASNVWAALPSSPTLLAALRFELLSEDLVTSVLHCICSTFGELV